MQLLTECPAASESTPFLVNRECHDVGLSFFAVACLPPWRNRNESRIALPTARPILLLDRIYGRTCDPRRRGCTREN